ncbi:GntR family transcriptional regulator [Roseomonas sp. USHLN139]|uniref:GntR family transcriptional regulator n=1 Tax=Roseomonas sp. USHLN139 TaxID=3081298 RepID=UPI003B0173DE
MSSAPALAAFASDELLSIADRAYRRLRDAIVDGSLAGGSRVSERSLALQLGISAQPVREALRRLEAEGMVVTSPRRGTLVAEFGPERLAEMGLVRIALEGAAAALAARRATPTEVAALRQQLREMAPATAARDIAALTAANERFHDLINAIAGNSLVVRSLQAIRAYDHFGRLRALRSSPQEPAVALREHAGIVAAIRRGAPKQAEARMRAHVERSLVASGILRADGTGDPITPEETTP